LQASPALSCHRLDCLPALVSLFSLPYHARPLLVRVGMDSCVEDEQRILDEWPKMPDGTDWDGSSLLVLFDHGESPFQGAWDVQSLICEIEQSLNSRVVDIPTVSSGANHYGLHVKLANRPDIVARLSRGDVNTPGFRGSTLEKKQLWHGHFELATYDALQPLAGAFSRRPLYHRDPVQPGGGYVLTQPQGITGRRLFLFEKAEGERYDYVRWRALSSEQKVRWKDGTHYSLAYSVELLTEVPQSCLLVRSARAAATLFKFPLPADYVSAWLVDRIFGSELDLCLLTMQPTREFCMALLAARIECTFRRCHCRFASRLDYSSASALLSAARDSLLRLVPRVLPRMRKGLDEATLYHFVLDHGDFGIHNMTVAKDAQDNPYISSVYDWEAGAIVPALFSEPKMVVTADLVVDEDGEPSVSRWGDGDGMQKMAEYVAWSREYYKALFAEVPEYRLAIKAGRDARHIWFALRDCENEDEAKHLAQLGAWADAKLAELDAMDRRGPWVSPEQCVVN
ncbi:Uncharacterized protein TCAP_00295, partial [Tolypocladium capitatum]